MQRIGVRLQQVSGGVTLLEKLKAEPNSKSVVLVDLSMPGLDLDVITKLRSCEPAPLAIIAYGPHVAEGRLAAAREAGCDRVLTRGQAHREMANVVSEFL